MVGDGGQESSHLSLRTPSPSPPQPRASIFGLANESYQPPWVVCGPGKEEGYRDY